MPLNLTGERVRLRPLETRDLPAILEAYRNLDLQLTTDGDVPPASDVQVKAFWEAIMTEENPELRYFAIEPVEGKPGAGEFVGACSLQHIDMRNRHAELAIWLASHEWHGKGYGAEATKLLLHYAFEVVRLDKIHLGVYDFNEAGIRTYERAGFRYEGRLRQMIYYEGRYWDEWAMGILRAEWEQYRHPPSDGLRPFHPAELNEALALVQKARALPNTETARALLRRWWRGIDRDLYSYQVNGELVALITLSRDTPTAQILDSVITGEHWAALEGMVARLKR